MRPLAERLRAARQRIESAECWTQGAYRRDASGAPALIGRGVCWCAIGALDGATEGGREALTNALTGDWAEANVTGAVECFNDDPDTTHTDVLALYDRAIAAAEVGS